MAFKCFDTSGRDFIKNVEYIKTIEYAMIEQEENKSEHPQFKLNTFSHFSSVYLSTCRVHLCFWRLVLFIGIYGTGIWNDTFLLFTTSALSRFSPASPFHPLFTVTYEENIVALQEYARGRVCPVGLPLAFASNFCKMYNRVKIDELP